MAKKRVLITGASGLLGGNLMYLFPDEWEIVGVVHQHHIAPPARHVHVVNTNLLDDDFDTDLRPFEPFDAIVHTAALTNVERCEYQKRLAWFLNADLVRRIAQYCERNDVHLIHISTDHVFDGKKGCYSEQDVPHPINYYAQTKLAAEKFLQGYDHRTTMIRTNFFGWNIQNKEDIAGWIHGTLQKREDISLFTDVFFSPILVNLFAPCIAEIIEKKILGTLHIAARDSCSKYEFGMKIANAFALEGNAILPIAVQDSDLRVPRPNNMTMNTEKAQATLSTNIPTVDTCIAEYKKLSDAGYPHTLRQLTSR